MEAEQVSVAGEESFLWIQRCSNAMQETTISTTAQINKSSKMFLVLTSHTEKFTKELKANITKEKTKLCKQTTFKNIFENTYFQNRFYK